MASKKNSKKRPPNIIFVLLISAGLMAVSFGVFFAMGAWDHDEHIPIQNVYVVDDDTLLVAGVSGKDSDVDRRRWSRIALLGLDGELRNIQRQRGPLQVIGVTDDLVWLRSHERGYHARTLPDLTLVEGMDATVKNHPVLSNRVQTEGFTEDFLVVRGADGKKYSVTRDGTIEKLPEDVEYQRRETRLPTEPKEEAFEVVKALQKTIKEAEVLETPSVVTDQRTRGPYRFENPDSVLVKSLEYVKGGRSQELHRVGVDGEVLWSATAAQLMDAFDLDGQTIFFDWVGAQDGKIVALIELSEYSRGYEGEDYSMHLQKIVEIDPKDGSVVASRDVVEPES